MEVSRSERSDALLFRHSQNIREEQARNEAQRSCCRTIEFPDSGEYSLDEVHEYFSRFGHIENDIVDDRAEPIAPEDGEGFIRITYPDARAAAEAVASQKPLMNSYGIHYLRIRLKK